MNATDQILARDHQTSPFESLELVSAPGVDPQPAPPIGKASPASTDAALTEAKATPATTAAALSWLDEIEPTASPSAKAKTATLEATIDRLLASYW